MGVPQCLALTLEVSNLLTNLGVIPGWLAVTLQALRQPCKFVDHAQQRTTTTADTSFIHQGGDRYLPSLVFLTHQVLARDSHIVKENFVKALGARHLDQWAHCDARSLHVNQDVADAAMLGCLGVGATENESPVGVLRLRRPDLLPGDS